MLWGIWKVVFWNDEKDMENDIKVDLREMHCENGNCNVFTLYFQPAFYCRVSCNNLYISSFEKCISPLLCFMCLVHRDEMG